MRLQVEDKFPRNEEKQRRTSIDGSKAARVLRLSIGGTICGVPCVKKSIVEKTQMHIVMKTGPSTCGASAH